MVYTAVVCNSRGGENLTRCVKSFLRNHLFIYQAIEFSSSQLKMICKKYNCSKHTHSPITLHMKVVHMLSSRKLYYKLLLTYWILCAPFIHRSCSLVDYLDFSHMLAKSILTRAATITNTVILLLNRPPHVFSPPFCCAVPNGDEVAVLVCEPKAVIENAVSVPVPV